MERLDLTGALKILQGERARMRQALTKLDKMIVEVRKLSGAAASQNGHPAKRTMSAASRRKIAKAQTLRWAKLRSQQETAA